MASRVVADWEQGKNHTMMEPTNAPLVERVKYFRDLTKKAKFEAARSRGALRLAFVRLAEGWEALANATEDVMATQAVDLSPDAITPKDPSEELRSHDRAF